MTRLRIVDGRPRAPVDPREEEVQALLRALSAAGIDARGGRGYAVEVLRDGTVVATILLPQQPVWLGAIPLDADTWLRIPRPPDFSGKREGDWIENVLEQVAEHVHGTKE